MMDDEGIIFDESIENPETLTEEELQNMRRAGMKKPEGITWSRWLSTKKISTRHNLIAYLAAVGMKNTEIAKEVGMTAPYIGKLLSDPKIKNEVSYLQRQILGEDPRKKFQSLIGGAIDVIEEVMMNKDEKSQVRLQAAQMVQERVLGRPTQQVDLGGNLIRTLFERLDQKDRDRKIIDVTSKMMEPTLLIEGGIDDNEPLIEKPIDQPVSEIDSWIETNLERGPHK